MHTRHAYSEVSSTKLNKPYSQVSVHRAVVVTVNHFAFESQKGSGGYRRKINRGTSLPCYKRRGGGGRNNHNNIAIAEGERLLNYYLLILVCNAVL